MAGQDGVQPANINYEDRYGPYAYIVTNIRRRYFSQTDEAPFSLEVSRWAIPTDLYRLDPRDLRSLLQAATGAERGDAQAFNVIQDLCPNGTNCRYFADSIIDVAGRRNIQLASNDRPVDGQQQQTQLASLEQLTRNAGKLAQVALHPASEVLPATVRATGSLVKAA